MNSTNTSWRSKERHDVKDTSKKYTMVSKGTSQLHHVVKVTSWCQKYVMTLKTYVMIIMTLKSTAWGKSDVMTSTSTQWRQNVCCDITRYGMTQKMRLHVKTIQPYLKCQLRLFLGISFRTLLAPIWRFYDVSFPSYQRLCVFHNFSDLDLDLWPMPVIFLDNADIIPGYLHINCVIISEHLTKS